jgi:taurine dioxygenase
MGASRGWRRTIGPEADVAIVPTGGALGGEVQGIDLRRSLDAPVVARLRAALLAHGVLLFRGQHISEAEQVRFTRHFGHPEPHVRVQPDRPIAEIFVISNVLDQGRPIGALGSGELTFHSDLSYLHAPGSLSLLYAVEVPTVGGDTLWANGYAAYDALDPALRVRVEHRRAVHRHPEAAQNPPTPASHPVIRPHPVTGRRVVYVNPQFTRYIEGMPADESRAVLDRLLAHVTHPRFVWRHRWRAGDLVIWDNRCTMHRREPFDDRQRRIMKRTQIMGETLC